MQPSFYVRTDPLVTFTMVDVPDAKKKWVLRDLHETAAYVLAGAWQVGEPPLVPKYKRSQLMKAQWALEQNKRALQSHYETLVVLGDAVEAVGMNRRWFDFNISATQGDRFALEMVLRDIETDDGYFRDVEGELPGLTAFLLKPLLRDGLVVPVEAGVTFSTLRKNT